MKKYNVHIQTVGGAACDSLNEAKAWAKHMIGRATSMAIEAHRVIDKITTGNAIVIFAPDQYVEFQSDGGEDKADTPKPTHAYVFTDASKMDVFGSLDAAKAFAKSCLEDCLKSCANITEKDLDKNDMQLTVDVKMRLTKQPLR